MKFYNPFKAHIVQLTNNKFAIRKYLIISGNFAYLSHNPLDRHWRLTEKPVFDTLSQAKERLKTYKTYKKPDDSKETFVFQ